MRTFVEAFDIEPGTRIIDLGGAVGFWDDLDIPCRITVLNLPGGFPEGAPRDMSIHTFAIREGDACHVEYADREFDIAFSNSVIEHVGDEENQKNFAGEVRRLAASYWVQTPSKFFPIEAHTGMPFWWAYPRALRDRIIVGWRKKLPAWTEMVEGTTVLDRRWLAALFPDATIKSERIGPLTKSYIAYRRR
jgi:hypothetical protein